MKNGSLLSSENDAKMTGHRLYFVKTDEMVENVLEESYKLG